MPFCLEIYGTPRPSSTQTRWKSSRRNWRQPVQLLPARRLEEAIQRIGEQLHSEYLISYSPNNKIEAGFHQISST